MQIFHNRPLAFACTLSALFAIFGACITPATKLFLILLGSIVFSVLLLACIWKKGGRKCLFSLLCVGAALLSLICSYAYFQVRYEGYRAYSGETILCEGVVLEREGSDAFYTTLRVSLSSVNGKSDRVLATLYFDHPTVLQVGDRFSVTAVAVDTKEFPTAREEKTFLADGKLLYLSAEGTDSYTKLSAESFDLRVFCARINLSLSYALRNCIGGKTGGIAAALLLGNRSWVDPVTQLEFRRAGISHLLALSGLHVSILIGFAERLLLKLRTPKTARAIAVMLLALGYLCITGFYESTWRAVLMVCISYAAVFAWSKHDPFTGLCVALAGILTVSPYALWSVSLWMSFLAAGSILIFSSVAQNALDGFFSKYTLPKLFQKLISSCFLALAVGLSANLALLLYSAFVFGEISLASIPATLVSSIPVTLLLILSLFVLLVPLLPLLPNVCGFLGDFLLDTAGFFSDLPNVMMPAEAIATKICLGILTAYLIVLAVVKWKRRILLLPIPILLALTVAVSQSGVLHAEPQIPIEVSAGHGELRLYTANGAAILVNDTRGNASEAYEIKQAAGEDLCTEIDLLVFHRYYNQATYFIKRLASVTRVRTVSLPEPMDERERAIAKRLEEEAALYGISVQYDAKEVLAALGE